MSEHEHECDRVAAREARKAARELVLNVARSRGVEIAHSCPLHSDHDRVLPHEQRKRALNKYQWKCNECGKVFKSEHYIDMHMARRHAALLSANATVCLGDFCDVLRCPSWLSGLRGSPHQCQESVLLARRHFCQHMLHDCLVDESSAAGHLLFESLDEVLCKPFNCETRAQLHAGAAVPSAAALGADADQTSGFYYVMAAVLIICIGALYVSMYCYYSAASVGRGDLRARRRRGRIGWGQWLKQKAY